MKQILAILAFTSFAYSQIVSLDCNSVYDRCQIDADNYKKATCDPFQVTNMTQYNLCLCFHQSQKLACFNQCNQADPKVQDQRLIQESVGIAACSPFKLNHNNPGRAPWAPADPVPNTTPGGGSGQTGSQTQPTPAKNDASQMTQTFFAVIAVVALSALI